MQLSKSCDNSDIIVRYPPDNTTERGREKYLTEIWIWKNKQRQYWQKDTYLHSEMFKDTFSNNSEILVETKLIEKTYVDKVYITVN